MHYVTSTCNYSTVLWSHHITSALWSTSRPRHQSPRLAYLFPACDSWFHITPVRPRALIWWFRSRISVTHWIHAQGRSEIVWGLSPDDRPWWKYVRLNGRWVLGNERTSFLDVLVETETWIDTYHIPNSKNWNWVKFGRLYVLHQIQSWKRIELFGCKLVFNF